MSAKNIQLETIIPPDTFFYIIPFENDDLILTKEVLYKHFESPLKTKRHTDRTTIGSIIYGNDIFTVEVTVRYEQRKNLMVHIGRDEISVSCECGMPGGLLCQHAYYGLFKLMHYRDIDLKRYYWPGFNHQKKNKNTYLDITVNGHNVSFEPKKEYGNLYRLGLGFNFFETPTFEKKIEQKIIPSYGNQEILGYAMVWTWLTLWSVHLPFIIPFIGKTNLGGDDIFSYLVI